MSETETHARTTAITFPWADLEECTFQLRLGEVRKLQEKTGLGCAALLRNLQTDNYKVDEFRETIMQGLLGAGMPIEKVRPLIFKWVDAMPAKDNVLPAISILLAWLVGIPVPPKPQAVEVQNEASAATAPADSISPLSTEQVPPLDSVPVT